MGLGILETPALQTEANLHFLNLVPFSSLHLLPSSPPGRKMFQAQQGSQRKGNVPLGHQPPMCAECTPSTWAINTKEFLRAQGAKWEDMAPSSGEG